jgi:hypothetical protein
MKVNYSYGDIHLVPNQSKMMNLLSTVKLNVFQFLLEFIANELFELVKWGFDNTFGEKSVGVNGVIHY